MATSQAAIATAAAAISSSKRRPASTQAMITRIAALPANARIGMKMSSRRPVIGGHRGAGPGRGGIRRESARSIA